VQKKLAPFYTAHGVALTNCYTMFLTICNRASQVTSWYFQNSPKQIFRSVNCWSW